MNADACGSQSGSCERAAHEIGSALDDWVRSGCSACNHLSQELVRLRSQTQVLGAFEREATDNTYTRQFEGKFLCEALHKVRVGDSVVVFQGRRESVQLECEGEGHGRQFRETCRCQLFIRDAANPDGRCLWEFCAEESTINECHTIVEPRVNVEAIADFVLRVGCLGLGGSEVVSFLVCLAGERVAEYFQWQMLRSLHEVIAQPHAQQVWRDTVLSNNAGPAWVETAPFSLNQAGHLKRKRSPVACSEAVQRQRLCRSPQSGSLNLEQLQGVPSTSVLGKRGRETAPLLFLA